MRRTVDGAAKFAKFAESADRHSRHPSLGHHDLDMAIAHLGCESDDLSIVYSAAFRSS
jgi:hypothetical protein